LGAGAPWEKLTDGEDLNDHMIQRRTKNMTISGDFISRKQIFGGNEQPNKGKDIVFQKK